MSKSKDLYCKAKRNVPKVNYDKKIKEQTKEFKKNLEKIGGNLENELNKGLSESNKKYNESKSTFQSLWAKRYGSSLRNRPDLIFLYDIILVFLFIFSLHELFFKVFPLFIPLSNPPAIVTKLMNLPESAFRMKDLEKQRVKQHAIGEHDKYFRFKPFDVMSQSDMMTMQYAREMLMFTLISMLVFGIPFLIGYIIWFIGKYGSFFFRTMVGLFKTTFRFFFRLIKAAASRKWIIRTVMGWPKLPYPNLSKEHISPWKRRYIDPWIDQQYIYYEILYRQTREKYYYQPKRKYVEIPYAKLKIFLRQLKREYIDLTYKEFWLLVLDTYPKFVKLPENELYLTIYGAEAYFKKYQGEVRQNLNKTKRRIDGTKAKCFGTGYESQTASGKKCDCPDCTPHDCGPVSYVSSIMKDANGEVAQMLNCSQENLKNMNEKQIKYQLILNGYVKPSQDEINGLLKEAENNKDIRKKMIMLGMVKATAQDMREFKLPEDFNNEIKKIGEKLNPNNWNERLMDTLDKRSLSYDEYQMLNKLKSKTQNPQKIFMLILEIFMKILVFFGIIISFGVIYFKNFEIPEKLKKYILPKGSFDRNGKLVHKKSILSSIFNKG